MGGWLYITTNPGRTTTYVGVSSNLQRRITEHYEAKGTDATYAGRFHLYILIYYEWMPSIMEAIGREKVIKKWNKNKKAALIATINPTWEELDLP